MKKTLIALALAATAVSRSAMAWTPNGLGGTMEFGGTLTPKDVVKPWEVQVGPNMDALNGSLKSNEKVVNITLSKAVPLLGIRVADASKKFTGAPGIAPQIDYKNAVDIDGFAGGNTTLALKVVKASDATAELGTLTAKFSAGAEFSTTGDGVAEKFTQYAAVAGDGFFGGLPKTYTKSFSNGYTLANEISPDYVAQYINQGASWGALDDGYSATKFNNPLKTYSSLYGAGLKSGSKVTINLTSPATADIAWKATFPVTVSYQ